MQKAVDLMFKSAYCMCSLNKYTQRNAYNMKKLIAVTLIALTVLTCVFAQATSETASSEKVYTVAVSCDYPPLEYIDDNGNPCGYEVELIQAVADVMGIKIEIANVSFDGIIAGIQGGQYDIGASGLTVTDERKQTVDFTTPVLQFALSIVTKNDNEDIHSDADLEGKKTGVQLGTTCQFACEDLGLTPYTYDEAPSAVLDLANGNLDAVVLDSVVAEDFVLQNESYSKVLKIAGSFENSDDMAMAVKKGNSSLLSLLNEGLEKVKESGKMAELKAKYGLN